MAKERKEESRREGEHKGKGLHLATIAHHFAEDGTAVHEHHYKAKPEDRHTMPPRMMGTSKTLEEAQQHLADHWPQQGGAEPDEGEEDQPGEGQGESEAEAQPNQGAPAGGGEEEEGE